MKRFARLAILLSFTLIFACKSMPECAPKKSDAEKVKKVEPYKVGDTIADFTLSSLDGKNEISFDKDIKGNSKVIALTFFTASCSSCKEEMKFLSMLNKKYGDKLTIYAIKEIFAANQKRPAQGNPLHENITYLKDREFAMMMRFGFTVAPALVIADGSGKITLLKGGYSSKDNPIISKAVTDILAR